MSRVAVWRFGSRLEPQKSSSSHALPSESHLHGASPSCFKGSWLWPLRTSSPFGRDTWSAPRWPQARLTSFRGGSTWPFMSSPFSQLLPARRQPALPSQVSRSVQRAASTAGSRLTGATACKRRLLCWPSPRVPFGKGSRRPAPSTCLGVVPAGRALDTRLCRGNRLRARST